MFWLRANLFTMVVWYFVVFGEIIDKEDEWERLKFSDIFFTNNCKEQWEFQIHREIAMTNVQS